ncbi:hypothetical protein BDV93DRAFT_475553 [Ceratobasidium sp. AG-I]|nr:hypothetical protein BDV93DRAFT_475553 [Ceratobasidium sp. AG-I]
MATTSSEIQPLPSAFTTALSGDGGVASIKTLVELEMTRLSAALRRKPDWWIKFRSKDILAKWRAEALAQAQQMRDSHVKYVLQELDGYANLRDEETGAEVSCYDRIWQSDMLVPPSLRQRLVAGVSKLENVPDSEKDWHPRSNGQVLDLVHPSLYPIVYERTLAYPDNSTNRDSSMLVAVPIPDLPPDSAPWWYRELDYNYHISRRFQWLPTDFQVSEDGKSASSLGYINNIHPEEHAELHKTIEELVGAYIPIFERALTDSIPQNNAVPVRVSKSYGYPDTFCDGPDYDQFDNSDDYEQAATEWHERRTILLPDVDHDYVLGSLEKREIRYGLAGKTIQVIVKLANIYLTPENPEYTGGSWHVEGMSNESIAVSGIYYYEQENISESHLAFRTAVDIPKNYEQEDHRGCLVTWGVDRDDPCVQHLGSVSTSQHRCIAFPNTYQHRVSPFKLVDKTKPGHRKILALFLVDPALHKPSTTTVPPQQQDWRLNAIAANPVLNERFAPEIINWIDSLGDGTMTRKEAEEYRLELMDERTAFVQKNTDRQFSMGFNMCEH